MEAQLRVRNWVVAAVDPRAVNSFRHPPLIFSDFSLEDDIIEGLIGLSSVFPPR